MTKSLTTDTSYQKLLKNLKSIFIEGLKKIEEEKVKTYWKTGRLISNYILENKERADYGGNLFEKLQEDLGIEKSTLLRTVKFYRTFPIVGALPQLSWLHYLQLITVKDEAKRKIFAQRAKKKGWGYRELQEAIRLERLKVEDEIEEKPSQSSVKLAVTRSRLYTYQVLEPSYIHPIEERMIIDLGFKFLIHTKIKGLRLKEGEIIESVKKTITKEDLNTDSHRFATDNHRLNLCQSVSNLCKSVLNNSYYSFKHSDAARKELYTYKALVEKVIDADTIWLNIDVGFSCWSRQKVRLRGIDAPEISTKKGIEAKAFVEARLKDVPFIIVKTHKSDKYDRYLADIFYLSDEDNTAKVLEEGIFLNQELLDRGLAREMED